MRSAGPALRWLSAAPPGDQAERPGEGSIPLLAVSVMYRLLRARLYTSGIRRFACT